MGVRARAGSAGEGGFVVGGGGGGARVLTDGSRGMGKAGKSDGEARVPVCNVIDTAFLGREG